MSQPTVVTKRVTYKNPLEEAAMSLTEALSDAEDLLSERNFGVGAQVALPDGRALGFGKIGKLWRLHVTSVVEGEAPQVVLLASTSRITRVWAADLLPALLRALHDARAAHYVEVQRAVGQVRAFNAALLAQPREPETL
jgi:hypothetical protein